jgi:hypothetical protein
MSNLSNAARHLIAAAEDIVRRVDGRLPMEHSIDRLEATAVDVRRVLRSQVLDTSLPLQVAHEASNTRPQSDSNQAVNFEGGKHVWLVDGDNQPAAIVPLLQAELGWPDVVVVCVDPVHRLNWGRRDIFPPSVNVIAKHVGLGNDVADIQLSVQAGRVVRKGDRVVIVSRDKLLTQALADSLDDIGAEITLAAILPIKSIRYPVLTLPIERVEEAVHSMGDAPVIKTPKARLSLDSLSMPDLAVSRLDYGIRVLNDLFTSAGKDVLLKSAVFARLSREGFTREEREAFVDSVDFGFEQCGTPQIPQIRCLSFVPRGQGHAADVVGAALDDAPEAAAEGLLPSHDTKFDSLSM